MIAVKAFAKKALLAFAVVCLVVFAVKQPDMLGELVGKVADGVISAVEAVVTMMEAIASE